MNLGTRTIGVIDRLVLDLSRFLNSPFVSLNMENPHKIDFCLAR